MAFDHCGLRYITGNTPRGRMHWGATHSAGGPYLKPETCDSCMQKCRVYLYVTGASAYHPLSRQQCSAYAGTATAHRPACRTARKVPSPTRNLQSWMQTTLDSTVTLVLHKTTTPEPAHNRRPRQKGRLQKAQSGGRNWPKVHQKLLNTLCPALS